MNCEDSFEDWKPLLKALMELRHYKALSEYQNKTINRLQKRIKALEFELELSKRKSNENCGMGNHL